MKGAPRSKLGANISEILPSEVYTLPKGKRPIRRTRAGRIAYDALMRLVCK